MLRVLRAFQRFSDPSGTYTVTLQDALGYESGVAFTVTRDVTAPVAYVQAPTAHVSGTLAHLLLE